jgi:hypothetical protein
MYKIEISTTQHVKRNRRYENSTLGSYDLDIKKSFPLSFLWRTWETRFWSLVFSPIERDPQWRESIMWNLSADATRRPLLPRNLLARIWPTRIGPVSFSFFEILHLMSTEWHWMMDLGGECMVWHFLPWNDLRWPTVRSTFLLYENGHCLVNEHHPFLS